jgi:site-specific recombinase XerC
MGRARATVTRRLPTIAGFYKYAVEEELLDHSPAAHVRRPPALTSCTWARRRGPMTMTARWSLNVTSTRTRTA